MTIGPKQIVSIIMPTYNRGSLIMEAIESIQKQTYREWELWIMDDGSDDDTEKMVREISDHRIHYVQARRTGVIGKLKNMGLAKATGDIIAFMDSDDLWDPYKLEKQLAGLDRYPGAGFSLTGGYTFYELGTPIDYHYKQPDGDYYGNILIPFFKGEIAALMPTLLFKRNCLERTGLFIESRLFSDIEFLLNLASHFNAYVIYEPLLFRRLHEENTTNKNWELGYTEYISLINSYRQSGKIPGAIARDALYRLYINFGEKLLLYKRNAASFVSFFKAWTNKLDSIIAFKKMAKAALRMVGFGGR